MSLFGKQTFCIEYKVTGSLDGVTPAPELTAPISKDEPAQAVAPGATDDYSAGFRVGSIWYDTVGTTLYTCVDPTTGAAVWV